jgi:hypothetical protein
VIIFFVASVNATSDGKEPHAAIQSLVHTIAPGMDPVTLANACVIFPGHKQIAVLVSQNEAFSPLSFNTIARSIGHECRVDLRV